MEYDLAGNANGTIGLKEYANMRIKHIKMETGERLPMLLTDNAVPDFWFTLYVGKLLRSQAQNTIECELNNLKILRVWEDYHERDLSLEFRDGRFLTDGDIESLADHCAYKFDAFKKFAASNKLTGKRTRALFVDNLLALKVPPPLKTVQFDSQYNRLTTIARHIKFVADTVCRTHVDKRESQTQISHMYNELLNKRPKSNASKSRGRYAHIPAASYSRFKKIAHTDYADNPFRTGESRNRNYLLVQIAHELGLRAGEILGLWVEDIEFGPKPMLSVVRRHNDPFDPRLKQLVAKTQERVLPISEDLAAGLNNYIISERFGHPYAEKHSILFVASQVPWRGHPLSYNSFANVFKSIGQVDPDRLAGITPHALRHDRACRFVDEIEAINHAAKVTAQVRF